MSEVGAAAIEQRTVHWQGGVIRALEAGRSGRPVIVLLHGVGSAALSWRSQLDGLAHHDFRVLAWDAPGYGQSDALSDSAPAAADYARALGALIDDLDVERCVVIGHSWGALIAAAFCASDNAARASRLVLMSPTPGFGKATDDVRRTKVDQRISEMQRLGPAGLAARRPLAVLGPHASTEMEDQVASIIGMLNPAGYVQAVRMMGREDIYAMAPSITQPTLVVSGAEDTITPEASCRRIAAAIANTHYESLPGLGHACYVEDPTACSDAILRFLTQVTE
jgi:pimeloyl-ACP methyl ester carboxylesterase